jgi:hypothetical protein
MSTEKTAGVFGPSASETEAALQKFYGEKLLNSAGAGAGLGIGAAALYHLLRGAKPTGKKEKKYPGYGSGTPMIAKQAFDINRIKEILGGALPTTMVPFSAPALGGSGAPSADPHAWRKSWSTAANIGGAGLGALAGGHLVNSIVKSKKKRDQSSALEAARQEYYNALRGKHAALDTAFESVKSANLLTSAISGAFQAPQALRTAYLLSMLGAGGLGAKYMYDKTKQTTEGENLAKAQASRARTRGLPPIYVDPEGLANVKAIAENDG